MTVHVRELARSELPALERHFLALDGADRRLRFGLALGDDALRGYVGRIDFSEDAVFGVVNDELDIVGAAHLANCRDRAELGLSVLPGQRAHGVGGALLARAHLHARNHGVTALYMHCLSENAPVMHLARKLGMDIVAQSGEAEAWLNLPPADASSHLGSMFEQRVALFDYALKSQMAGVRRVASALGAAGTAPL